MTVSLKNDLIKKVDVLLDSLRPYLAKDGGNIEVVDITDEMVVKVKLLGACENCPTSYMTMKAGVEETIKRALPEIQSVVAINGLNVA